jgi:hypothetical protein
MGKKLRVRVFTDPTCGEQLEWHNTMIVLSGYQDETSSMTPDKLADGLVTLSHKYSMPMDTTVRPRLPQSIKACRGYVAARGHDAAAADVLLRNLRVAGMSGGFVDEQPVIDKAADEAGIDPADLAAWTAEPATEEVLAADAEATRQPTRTALGFRRKLSETSTGRVRYSAPSYQFSQSDKILFELPGYWPLEAYEAAICNIAPGFERADDPESVRQVLEWARTPLATIEVATIHGSDTDTVRPELEKIAAFEPVGEDGFWRLK